MIVRSQQRLNKLDLSLNTETLENFEPDCSLTSDKSRRFSRKPSNGVRLESSRMKKVGSQTRVFAGFFSPTNQQLGEIIKDKSESDLKKLLFRNFPSTTTNAFSKRQQHTKLESQNAPEQPTSSSSKSVYEVKTDRRRISDEAKENNPNKTLRKFPSQQTEIELSEVDQLRREIQRLREENIDLRTKLNQSKKNLGQKTHRKQTQFEELEVLYRKSMERSKEIDKELLSIKMKNIRLEAQTKTKQELVNFLEKTVTSLNQKLQDEVSKYRLLESRLQFAESELHDKYIRIQSFQKEIDNLSCKLHNAQQKHAELEGLKVEMKRQQKIVRKYNELKATNYQLTRKIDKLMVIKDHELFDLSSSDEESVL